MREGTALEAIYKNTPIGLALFDRDLHYLRVNDAMAEMNGLPIEHHLGRTIYEVLPAVAPDTGQLLQQVFRSGKPLCDVEISGETPRQPGVRRTWMENITPILGDGGTIQAILVTTLDITERKDREKRMLEALSRQQILSCELSHRISNSLQVICSALSLQARLSTELAARSAFESAGQRLHSLSLVHGRLHLSMMHLDAPETGVFIQGLCDDIRVQCVTGNHVPDVQVECDSEIRIPHDKMVALGMIVAELVTNACKHADDGEMKNIGVYVILHRVGRHHVQLTVSDNGRGLPPDLDILTSNGLGMKMVVSQAQQLEGTLDIDRAPPGVRFNVTFPASE